MANWKHASNSEGKASLGEKPLEEEDASAMVFTFISSQSVSLYQHLQSLTIEITLSVLFIKLFVIYKSQTCFLEIYLTNSLKIAHNLL